MPDILTAAEIETRGLADWRSLLGRLEATFRCPSFGVAGRLVLAIADAADAAGHHPDVDLRYPGVLHVALTTHAAGARTTELDVALAEQISLLAADAGATSRPGTTQALEIAVDAMDIAAVHPFWQAVTGYAGHPADPEVLVDPVRRAPSIWFQQMDASRPQRNRIHVDITVAPEVAEARVAAALAAGGRLVDGTHARSWWVLADAEGNEVCICTWLDR
ncbi:MAG: VOC family protein [Ilumatobacteraceae bacterium]